MSNTRTYEELKQRLDAMADEMHGRKSEPNAAAKKQIAAYNSAFWNTMHTGMPNNELKVGSDGAGGIGCGCQCNCGLGNGKLAHQLEPFGSSFRG